MLDRQEAKEIRNSNEYMDDDIQLIDRIYNERGICDLCTYRKSAFGDDNKYGHNLICNSPKFVAKVRWDDYCWQFKEDS